MISRYGGEVNRIHAISSGSLWRCLLAGDLLIA